MHGPREDNTLPLPLHGRRASAHGSPRGAVRYRVLTEIARGGMGAVLRAHDPELGRVLALKVLLEEHAADPEMVSRFLEEARITSRLQHPGIVPIHDIGRFADDRPFFTMKLVEGRTFAAHLAARVSPGDGQQRMLDIFEAVCRAIAYAHSRGVIHRDIKPSNVMVGEYGEVQVMDWGVAKVIRPDDNRDHAGDTSVLPPITPSLLDRTLVGAVVGTPAYMAPEQARGEAIDERADVFGLGAILCEILTGRPPYGAVRGSSVFLLNQDRDLAEALARLDGCPADAELVALARACLADDPRARPANAGVVSSRMEAYRAGVRDRLHRAEIERAAAEARSDEAKAKAAAERRARRMGLGLTAAILLVAGLLAFAGWRHRAQLWHARERSAALLARGDFIAAQAGGLADEEAALDRLREALALADQALEAAHGADGEARRQASEARSRLGREITRREDGRHLAERLIEVRLKKEDDFIKSDVDGAYKRVFAAHGLDIDDDLAALADKARGHRPAALAAAVAALDDWARERRRAGRPPAEWQKPMRLAALIDDDIWRGRLRGLALDAPPSSSRSLSLLAATLPAVPGVGLALAGLEATYRRAGLRALAGEAAGHGPAGAQMLAAHLREEGLTDDATKVLRLAQHRHPGDVWLNYDLAVLLERRSPAEALRFYTAARSVRPEVGHGMAHVLGRLGRHDESEEMLREMVRLRPAVAAHRACLGTALLAKGRLDEAKAQYEEARRLAPDMHQGHFGLGRIAMAKKDHHAAIPLLERAAALARGETGPWRSLGHTWQALKQWRKAEDCFRRALEIDPRDVESRFHVAHLLDERGLRTAAITEYRIVLQHDPDNHEARANMGAALSESGRRAEGLPHLQKAAAGRPSDPTIRKLLGNAYANLGRHADAAAEYKASIDLDGTNAGVLNGLGSALVALGRFAEALPVFERSSALSPKDPGGPYNAGNALALLGRHADAVARFDEALKRAPGYAEALCNKGQSLRRIGRFAEAAEALRQGHDAGKKRKDWRYPSDVWAAWAERLASAEKRLPALLAGAPASREDRMAAADVCLIKGDRVGRAVIIQMSYAEGARWVAPSVAAAAALDAAGVPTLTPEASARWRGQAHAWARLEVRHHAGRARAGDGVARDALRRLLDAPAFAAVRGGAAFDGLPAHERQAWSALWRAVQAALAEVASLRIAEDSARVADGRRPGRTAFTRLDSPGGVDEGPCRRGRGHPATATPALPGRVGL